MKTPAHLIDTTLREGEQTVGVHFTTGQKKEIIKGLTLVGISEIEIGIATPFSNDLKEIVDFCRIHYPQLKVSLWCRCKAEDILHASTLGIGRLSLSIPVSDLHLHSRLGKTRAWALETMQTAILLALQKGMEVSVGFEDATRAEPQFLTRMAKLAEHSGAFRIRLADTVGLATPVQIISLITEIRETVNSCDIAIHTHNDFGMATANAITALESGAKWADVTILGLGERSGCAHLEEVAGYLSLMRSDTLRARYLKPLAGYVAAISHRVIEDCRPVIGEKIFACETGLHLQGLYRNPDTYEPYAPELVGTRRHLITGRKCGRNALRTRLSTLGVEMNDDLLLEKLHVLRNDIFFTGWTLSDDEFLKTMLPS